MAIAGRSYANVPIVKRAHLEDEYRRGTTPVVRVRQAGVDDPRFRATLVGARAHLLDEFRDGTSPLVIAAPTAPRAVLAARLHRAPLAGGAPPPEDQPGVRQVIINARLDPRWTAHPTTPGTSRAHLEDSYYRGTSPLIVAAPVDRRWTFHPTSPTVERADLEDYVRGTQPVVFAPQPDPRLLTVDQRGRLWRAHIEDTYETAHTQLVIVNAAFDRRWFDPAQVLLLRTGEGVIVVDLEHHATITVAVSGPTVSVSVSDPSATVTSGGPSITVEITP